MKNAKTIARRILWPVMDFTCLSKEHVGKVVGPRNCIWDIHGSTTRPTLANLVCEESLVVSTRSVLEVCDREMGKSGEPLWTRKRRRWATFLYKAQATTCRYAGRGEQEGRLSED